MFIEKLVKALNKHKIKYSLVGGYAVVLHGIQRGTVDIDFVTELDEKSLVELEKALHSIGLQSKIPVGAKEIANFRKEYIQRRNLIAWSFVNPKNPLEVVDILLTHDYSEFQTEIVNFSNLKISILAIDDLIKLKKEASRPQDIEDIKNLQAVKKLRTKK